MSPTNETKRGYERKAGAAPTGNRRKFLLMAGRILLLLIVVIGAIQLGRPATYYDPYGLLFVVLGGAALVLISFPAAEIGLAFRHAAGRTGSEAEIRRSVYFWEAAGRGFWMLGGLRSILSIVLGFIGMSSEYAAGMPAILPMLIRALLSTFYGSLLAVICFIPCWKLMGRLRDRLLTADAERGGMPAPAASSGWRIGALIGYAIFLAVLIATIRLPHPLAIWTVYRPSLFVVLGGTLALMLFLNGSNARLTPSAAFAGMGLLGSLMGFIQMLHGMTIEAPQGIGQVAGALAFILCSCFTALLGMAVIGAPLEDRAIRAGWAGAPSAFSRVSWYVFPLLSLVFLVLVFNMITLPLPAGPPR